MGNTILKLLVSLGLDSSDYTKGLDEAEGKANRTSKNIVNGLSTVGKGVVIAGAAAGAAATAFIASTIAPASDLAETVSKVGVVFENYADSVIKFGDNAAESMGMSKNEALAAAATYGNLFRAMEISTDASFDMSTGLVSLASDLASFNNMDPTVVLDKLRAGLSGETEPLKTLGVNLNAAMLEAKALEMGLWDGEGAITAAAKAQASYALIMEQTTLAQGDFARTSDGLANQQRIIAANFKNMKATIGTALLPMIEKLSSTLNSVFSNPAFQAGLQKLINGLGRFASKVVEVIPQVIDWFGKMGAWFSENQGVIVGILAAIGVAVAAFVYTTVIPAIVSTIVAMAPVLLVMAAVAAVAYLVYEAWTNNWGGIQDKLKSVWAVIQPIFQTIKTWLQTNIPKAIDVLTSFWNDKLLPAIQAVWAWIKTNLFPLFDALAELLEVTVGLALTALAGFWQNVLQPAIQDMFEWFNDKLMPVLKDVAGWLKDKLSPAFDGISTAISKVIGWIKGLTDKLKNIKLPDWLTPGSPTPFETGLWGIQDALKSISRTSLPAFHAQLEFDNIPSTVVKANVGVDGQTTGNNYYTTVYSNSSPDEFSRSIDFAKGYALA
jgi:hypothetical protein